MPKMRLEWATGEGEMHGSLIGEHKRCGKPNCRCARGRLHGPYYYRRWRDATGRQRKEYVPRERVPEVQLALAQARADTPRVRLRELKKLLDRLDGDAKAARQRMGEELGRSWHGRRLRERRSFPAEQRDRALYRLNPEAVLAACGWQIAEDDFVRLQQMVRSERKRRNRLGLPCTTRDPATGQAILALKLDLMELPSYRGRVARQMSGREREVTDREEAD